MQTDVISNELLLSQRTDAQRRLQNGFTFDVNLHFPDKYSKHLTEMRPLRNVCAGRGVVHCGPQRCTKDNSRTQKGLFVALLVFTRCIRGTDLAVSV